MKDNINTPAVERRTASGFSERESRAFKRRPDAVDAALANLNLGAIPVAPDHTGPATVGDLVNAEAAPVWIHHSKMTVWVHNPRHVIDPQRLRDLGDTLAKDGQSDPVDVFEDPKNPGHYFILKGQRRWRAIKEFNLQEGKVLTRIQYGSPSLEQLLAAAVSTQVNTEALSDLDFAITLVKLNDEAGVREMSRMIGKTAGEVSKLVKVGNLPDSLLRFLMEHSAKFSTLFGYEVCLVNDKLGEVQARQFAEQIQEKGLTHKAAVALKEKLLGDREPVRRSSWSTIRLPKDAGSMRLKESTGEVALKIKGLSPAGLQIIKDAVERATTDQAQGAET